jgi:hypothetical protein
LVCPIEMGNTGENDSWGTQGEKHYDAA